MAVTVAVSDVRKEIYRKTGRLKNDVPDVRPSTLLLGRVFHEAFALLFSENSRFSWRSVLAHAEADEREWEKLLEEHLYNRLIGPRLGRERVHLQDATEQVVTFWKAASAMSRWVASLLWAAREESRGGKASDIHLVVSPEEPLSMKIQEKGWKDSVFLTGIADLVLRIPGREPWCIVELKLGQGCLEADLAQACLYHLALSSRQGDSPSAMALVSFRPQKEERLYKADALQAAQKTLKALIGRLAGVVSGKPARTQKLEFKKPVPEDPEKYSDQARQLVAIFREYGKEITLEGSPIPGPTFIRHPIRLGKGVKLSGAQTVARELHHRLHLEAPPYVHLSEGDVVIDVQRADRKAVLFSDIRDQLPQKEPETGSARVLLGVDLNTRLRFADLAEPDNVHILVAGTTGSGKSEWLRSALAGLVLTNTPDTLRLVLIDPKRSAFSDMKDSPFLLSAEALVHPDEQPASGILAHLADEMDTRYMRLHHAGVDGRDEFVRKTGEPMPRIICFCDEYFDLIGRGRKERDAVETQVFRLGAKARAAGIHLIIATQHPSRNVIKGALDANLPARIGLKMSKPIESNMLLNQKGAENLLGSGDLLFKDIGDPVRLQCPYLPPEERRQIFGVSPS
jgi:hypothetical protein